MKSPHLTDALYKLGVSDDSDLEAVRREFARKYNALEEYSLHTSSVLLKSIYENSMESLCKAYCTLLNIETIQDMSALLALSENIIVGNLRKDQDKSNDPYYAQLIFGMLLMSSSDKLTVLFNEIIKDLKGKMDSLGLESSKVTYQKEIELISKSYDTCIQQSIQVNLDEIRQETKVGTNEKMKRTSLFILIGFSLIILALSLIYFNL
jgi:hypothetical protein